MIALVTAHTRAFSVATTFADLIQEGNLALLKAVHTFSYHQATLKSFHAFLKTHVTNQLHWYFYKDLPFKTDPRTYLAAKQAGREDILHALKYPTRLDQPIREQERTSAARIAAPPVVLPPQEETQQDQEDAERHVQLEALIDTLPPKLRIVVRLHLGFDGQALSFQEIRKLLGLRGRSTASTRYVLAMQKLQASVLCR